MTPGPTTARCARCGGVGTVWTLPTLRHVVTWEHAPWCPIAAIIGHAVRPRDEYDYLDGVAAPFEPGDFTEPPS